MVSDNHLRILSIAAVASDGRLIGTRSCVLAATQPRHCQWSGAALAYHFVVLAWSSTRTFWGAHLRATARRCQCLLPPGRRRPEPLAQQLLHWRPSGPVLAELLSSTLPAGACHVCAPCVARVHAWRTLSGRLGVGTRGHSGSAQAARRAAGEGFVAGCNPLGAAHFCDPEI